MFTGTEEETKEPTHEVTTIHEEETEVSFRSARLVKIDSKHNDSNGNWKLFRSFKQVKVFPTANLPTS